MPISRNPARDVRRFWCCECLKYLSNWSSMKRHMAEYHDSQYTLTMEDPRSPNQWLCGPWNLPREPTDFPYGEEYWGIVSNNQSTIKGERDVNKQSRS